MKRLPLFAAIIAAALAVAAFSIGSSHREAPNTANDPTADDTDVYAFTAADAPGSLTRRVELDPVRGSGRRAELLQLRPEGALLRQRRQHRRRPLRRPLPLRVQDADPEQELVRGGAAAGALAERHEPERAPDLHGHAAQRTGRTGSCARSRVVGRNLPAVPSNIGPKTMPDYDALARAGHPLAERRRQGVRRSARRSVLRRPRPDVRLDQLPAGRRYREPGRRQGRPGGLQRHTRSSCRCRSAQVTRDGSAVSAAGASNAVVGVWSSTERRRLQVTNAVSGRGSRGRWVQVSRLGNPLVNEVVIPLGKKDQFNRTQPQNDARLLRQVRRRAGAGAGS